MAKRLLTESQERRSTSQASRRLAKAGLNAASIQRFLDGVLELDLHVKTILSLSLATLGVLHAASLCIHVIGRAMAWARGVNPKHATKQVDRLLSNGNVCVEALEKPWVRYLVSGRTDLLVALDWTEFDADDQSTIAAYLITNHGRATPLLWQTVRKSSLEGQRAHYEYDLLERLHDALPEGVRVTILADRGFGDQKLYGHLKELNFDFVIRFKENITVTLPSGDSKPASQWLPASGRATKLKEAAVTQDCYILPAVVLVHARGMKDSWCLATSRDDLTASGVVKLYGRRFTIEETFRDTKDIHFGMGLKATHIGDCARRDRLLFIAAMAHVLLTLLGAAGERAGLDRLLKTNTAKKRTMSLYNQGCYWYMAIPNLPEERLAPLMQCYADILREHEIMRETLGII